MLTKIIDLGFEVPETGEPRVKLVSNSLVKTASSEIQDFWDSIEPDGKASYLWVIGVSAREFYGCNNNGDAFDEADLKKCHERFVNDARVFLQHVNKDPAKSIGRPVFSWYNDVMHRVELVLKIDKTRADAAAIIAKIQNDEPIFVSMGCTVEYDVCSICGNAAKTRKEYCDHLRFNMKKILPDGRQVYALNPNPRFFDISIVRKPADSTAWTLDKRASEGSAGDVDIASRSGAELGEIYNDLTLKTASIKKLSDIIKRVDGHVADVKDDAISQIRENGFENIDYPEMPYSTLSNLGTSPLGFLSALNHLGCPPTLGDAAWLCGCRCLGHEPSHSEMGDIFSWIPKVLPRVQKSPDIIDGLLKNVLGAYNGEFDDPVRRTLIIKVMRPVAEARITIIRSLSDAPTLMKLGAVFGKNDEEVQFGDSTVARIKNDFRSRKRNFAPITLRDKYGNEVLTSPYMLRQADFMDSGGMSFLVKPLIVAAIAAGSMGAVMSQPTLARKLVALAACGVPVSIAAKVIGFGNSHNMGVTTSEGYPISDKLVETTFKMEKKAEKGAPSRIRMGTLAGMAVPGALALDYAWNKWRYGPYGPPENSTLHNLGETVVDHPVVAGLVGGVAGSQIGPLSGKLWKHFVTKGKK